MVSHAHGQPLLLLLTSHKGSPGTPRSKAWADERVKQGVELARSGDHLHALDYYATARPALRRPPQ